MGSGFGFGLLLLLVGSRCGSRRAAREVSATRFRLGCRVEGTALAVSWRGLDDRRSIDEFDRTPDSGTALF